jgi:Fe-S cluster assembly protein SufD
LPGKRDEDWRWTDLRGLIRKLPPPSEPFGGDLGAGPFDALATDRRTIVNGRGAEPVEIARDASATVAVRFVARGAGVHIARLQVSVGVNARLVLLESYESDGASLAQAALDITLASGASIERIVLAQDHAEAVSVSQAKVRLAHHAAFAQTVVTSGARRQRLETQVQHPGGGASVRLDGVYLLAEKRHADQTTVVTHAGTDGVTVQLTKGVVRDQARGVFQGRIVVQEGADRTDARMGHHALILSDRAEVDAKPELEIYADDVACAHGNTVGALDDDAMFYARQRGIPEAEARALLTEAFIGEVVDRIGHEGACDAVRAWAAERLRA